MVHLNVNAQQLPTEIKDEFAPLPDGTYPALLAAVEEKNDQVVFEIHITQGEYAGRKHFEWLSFTEANPDKQWLVDKALQTLGSIVHATGSAGQFTNDTSVLLNKPFLIDLKMHQGKNYQDKVTGETRTPKAKNIIKGIHAMSQTQAPVPQAQVQQPAPQQAQNPAEVVSAPATAAGGAPWAK